jgi:transcriptional regulator with XRE-family HTH domain
MKKTSTITAVLLKAIKRSGESRYAIAKATGLNESALSRFASGKQSIRLDKADVLAAYLGVRIVIEESKGR